MIAVGLVTEEERHQILASGYQECIGVPGIAALLADMQCYSEEGSRAMAVWIDQDLTEALVLKPERDHWGTSQYVPDNRIYDINGGSTRHHPGRA